MPDGHQILVFRDFFFAAAQLEVLKDQHGVIVPNGAFEQALHIVGTRGDHNFESRHTHELGVDRLGMLGRCRADRAAHGPEGNGHVGLAARHIAQLGGLITDLIPATVEKAGKLDFNNRPHPGHGRTHPGTGITGF